MNRSKWAVLGLAALALAALSAFAAGGAQADEAAGEFTCLEGHTTHVECTVTAEAVKVHREHDEKFQEDHTYEAGEFSAITCETAITHGEDADGTDPTPKVTPTYENCNASGLTAHVDHGGCEFELHPEETSGKTTAEDEYVGTADIVDCNEGESITVEITRAFGGTKCHIEIHEQEDIGPIYFRTHTEGETTDVTVEAATAEVQATFEGGFFDCGVTNGEHPTFYTGNTTATAKNSKNETIDLSID